MRIEPVIRLVYGEVAAVQEHANDTRILQFGPHRLVPSKRLLLQGEQNDRAGRPGIRHACLAGSSSRRGREPAAIIDEVWPDLTVDETNLRVPRSRSCGERSARRGADYVKNVRGRGYVFVAPVQSVPSSPAATTPLPIRGRLPGRLQRLVGRKRALDAIAPQMLACRFVGLVGAGGIGKTTLGHRAGPSPGRRVRQPGLLRRPRLAQGSRPRLADRGRGARLHGQRRRSAAGIVVLRADRRPLLVLDCCEHVIEAVASLAAALFRHAAAVHILGDEPRAVVRAEGETVISSTRWSCRC